MMTREKLADALRKPYSPSAWKEIYPFLFRNAHFFAVPQDVKERNLLIESFKQLGYVDCGGERLILFDVEVKPAVHLRQNRVTLNNILAKWLTAGDCTAAIGVFHRPGSESYRFTFVRKTASFDDRGNLVNTRTCAKRYTYVLGAGKHCVTAVARFDKLHGIASPSMSDVEDAFSVEALTKQFYQELFAWYQRAFSDDAGVTFPNDTSTPTDDRHHIAEHLIRLITRLMFVWFIKQKDLVPKKLFRPDFLKTILKDFTPDSASSGNYYNAVLQNLFFATLNNEIDKRAFAAARSFQGKVEDYGVKTLFRNPENDSWFKISNDEVLEIFSSVPFLNGGLFECLDKDTPDSQGKIIYSDGFSRRAGRQRRAFIPNALFFDANGLIPLLERYNFTVEENSPEDVQVALDPEMLGKVFENLLGTYNPETQATARNSSGSFYTPREVVHYMVDEALIAALGSNHAVLALFQSEELPESLKNDPGERKRLAARLKSLKILDPACGSGAFPMGVLNRMFYLLQKLEASGETPYEQKLHLIENCIYGIDIQTIAVQISKLRFFISLICEQDKDPSKENFGIPTLPNLETKFIAANSLLSIKQVDSQGDLFENPEIEKTRKELLEIRHRHFNAKNSIQKKECRRKDKELRDKLAVLLSENEICDREDARQLAAWNPYDQNESSSFFDSEWMFGFSDGFDVVIGNPPYIQLQNNGGELAALYEKCGFKTFVRTGDIYSLFYEQGFNSLKNGGHLCFITSNKWMRAGYGEATRKFFAENTNPVRLIDFAGQKIFESATVDVNIILFSKAQNAGRTLTCVAQPGCRDNLSDFIRQYGSVCAFEQSSSWVILSPIEQSIKRKIEAVGTPLKDWDVKIYRGILTGCNEAFIIDETKRKAILANCADADERARTDEIIRPILRGRDIKRYTYEWAQFYIIATFPSHHYDIDDFPSVRDYLVRAEWRHGLPDKDKFKFITHDGFGKLRLEQSGQTHTVENQEFTARKKTHNKWFETQDQIGYWDDFSKPKIVWGNLALSAQFARAPSGMFVNAPCPMIVPCDGYLLAVLNSKLGDWYIRHLGVTRNGGYFEYKPMFIEQLPVPQSRPQMAKKLAALAESPTKENQIEIDRLIFELFGLSQEEIAHVLSSY